MEQKGHVRAVWLAWAAVFGVALTAVVLLIWTPQAPAVLARPSGPLGGASAADYDLLALLRELQQANADIHEANAGILITLHEVEQQAARVEAVYLRLDRLEEGLGQQQASLERLLALTAEQAALSGDLRDLTAAVVPSTAGLARTAADQAISLEGMSIATDRLAAYLRDITIANDSTAQKLERAEALSALILTRMP